MMRLSEDPLAGPKDPRCGDGERRDEADVLVGFLFLPPKGEHDGEKEKGDLGGFYSDIEPDDRDEELVGFQWEFPHYASEAHPVKKPECEDENEAPRLEFFEKEVLERDIGDAKGD